MERPWPSSEFLPSGRFDQAAPFQAAKQVSSPQLARIAPGPACVGEVRRGGLEAGQERVDIDVRQLPRLIGLVRGTDWAVRIGGIQLEHQAFHIRRRPWIRLPKELDMKRLLGLLLVMGMVGCVDPSEIFPKFFTRDGLLYERDFEGDSETPLTGVVVWLENGQKWSEVTYKDGKQEGSSTVWHENGQKWSEQTFKKGKREGPTSEWHKNGKKQSEQIYKDGKREGLNTWWHDNGQKGAEYTYKDGKKVSETRWDEEGNEIK